MKTIGERQIFSVSDLNLLAKETLQQIKVWVEGEVAALSTGNWTYAYFSLKDPQGNSLIPCVVDPRILKSLDFACENGINIVAYGYLSLYEPRGQYQFKVSKIEAAGEGLLLKQLEELKKKLDAEGLFSDAHKLPLPLYPIDIGVITSTSASSAAWTDFQQHSIEKYPFLQLTVHDVHVQGQYAIQNVCEALALMDTKGFDALVLTRGGGSIEDLMAFNSEEVARAVYACKTPIVVAIGHEKDVSIAELVADVRASTPTAAANELVRHYPMFFQSIQELYEDSIDAVRQRIDTRNQQLDYVLQRLKKTERAFIDLPSRLRTIANTFTHVHYMLEKQTDILPEYQKRFSRGIIALMTAQTQKTKTLGEKLDILSPVSTLKRGYSIVRGADMNVLRSSANVEKGEELSVQLANGSLQIVVKEAH